MDVFGGVINVGYPVVYAMGILQDKHVLSIDTVVAIVGAWIHPEMVGQWCVEMRRSMCS